MSEELLDAVLISSLQVQVADEMTAMRQRRDALGERELSKADERQLARSLMQATVSRHMELRMANGLDLPESSYDERLVQALDQAIFEAGAISGLLADNSIENININGCDEVWITYADERGKVRGNPVAASDEDLIALVQTLGSYGGLNARPFTRAHPELDVRLPDGSPVVGGDERHRAAQCVDSAEPIPADEHGAAGPSGYRGRTVGGFSAGRRQGQSQYHDRRGDRRRKD